MTVLSRRSFLGGVLAVAGAVAISKVSALEQTPRIWADGIHDDTAGLQAAFDGKPFICGGKAIVQSADTELFLGRGMFRLGPPGLVCRGSAIISGCEFRAGPEVKTLFNFTHESNHCLIHNCIITGEADGPLVNINSTSGPLVFNGNIIEKGGCCRKCQSCDNTNLTHILSLGPLPPCNDMRPIGEPARAQEWMPTDLMYCSKCELVQLEYIGDPRVVFPASYPYTSGSTKLLRDNFADLAREATNFLDLKFSSDGPDIVDIGSNDGTLLSNFKSRGFQVLGIEPTDVANIAIKNGIRTTKQFFNSDVARDTGIIDAKLITCCNCFAHMKDVHDVLDGIDEMLADDGVFVTESHYLIDLIDRLQYDTIYHEHLRYYSLTSLRNLLEQHGLHVFNAKKIPTHGGSIRVYARRGDGGDAIDAALLNEPTGDALYEKLFNFGIDVVNSKLNLMEKIKDIKGVRYPDSIVGIGAPSRASTVINYCRLDGWLIDFVAEIPTSLKIGKHMPGTNIPVIDESKLFKNEYPHAILFSWHLADELIPMLKAKGYKGKFIIPCERAKNVPSPALRQLAPSRL